MDGYQNLLGTHGCGFGLLWVLVVEFDSGMIIGVGINH